MWTDHVVLEFRSQFKIEKCCLNSKIYECWILFDNNNDLERAGMWNSCRKFCFWRICNHMDRLKRVSRTQNAQFWIQPFIRANSWLHHIWANISKIVVLEIVLALAAFAHFNWHIWVPFSVSSDFSLSIFIEKMVIDSVNFNVALI